MSRWSNFENKTFGKKSTQSQFDSQKAKDKPRRQKAVKESGTLRALQGIQLANWQTIMP
jgi:hypothetical protein